MKFRRTIIGIILIFILPMAIFEIALRFKLGMPPPEAEPYRFKYDYEDIYERVFKKVRLSDGTLIYTTQQEKAIQQSFPVHKGKNSKRIFIMGGSVAQALCTSGTQYFQDLLASLTAGERFEVICCGMSCYDSYRESIIQKEILSYNPDLIILMSGNNEFYTPVRVNPYIYKLNRIFRKLWIYRKPQDWIVEYRRKGKNYEEIYANNRLANFENNLRIMIRRAKERNIPMALCTLPANFRDCPPEGALIRWQDKQFFLAKMALERKEFEKARNGFEQFLIKHPKDVFGNYFLAKCLDALGYYPQAQTYYLKALDLDATPGNRCPPKRNEVIRRLCSEEGIILIDLERLFISMAPHGLVGKELFFEHCHWWEEYNSMVFKEMVQSIARYRGNGYKVPLVFLRELRYDPASEAKNLLTKKDASSKERALRLVMYAAIDVEPQVSRFSTISFASERAIAFLDTAYRLNPGLFDNNSALKDKIYEGLSINWWIQDKLPELDKIWLTLLYHIGENFRRSGEYDKAIKCFNEVIDKDPDICFSFLGRGLTYQMTGKSKDARNDFEELAKKCAEKSLVYLYRDYFGI